jgi:dTDP-4-dehydrorhamnose 3,5-epimerase
MLFRTCQIGGVQIIDPAPHEDERGRFYRAWCLREFREQGNDFTPAQANMALSMQAGTMRGVHYQIEPAPEAKLVRCTAGEIFDVVVDLRPTSPTFRSWHGEYLSAENGRMVYVPEGCGHGCLSIRANTEIYYLTSAFYNPEAARGVRYDDPAFGIRWPLPIRSISEQDGCWPPFKPG